MRRPIALASVLVVSFALASCGGTEPPTDSGVWACDIAASSGHKCAEYSWTGGKQSTDEWANQCAMNGGQHVAACDHQGAVGGCATTNNAAQIVVTLTLWWYYGMESSVRDACALSGATFVKP